MASSTTHEAKGTNVDAHDMDEKQPSVKLSEVNQDPQQTTTNSSLKTDVSPPRLARSRLSIIGLIITCTAAMVLNTANSTAISIALPTIGRDLGIVENKLQWLVSAYSLSSGCLLLFLGRLADLYGRKRTFLLGIFVQAAFGLGCAFSKDEITIDVLRGLQGIGGAAIIPAAIGIMADAFPPSRLRAIAFSTFGAGAPIGASIGNLIGGVLTELTSQSWRSTLYMMTGLSALAFIGGYFTMDADVLDMTQDRRIDWIGAFLVTAGLVLISSCSQKEVLLRKDGKQTISSLFLLLASS
ncbi:hypothetical protein QCA50_006266 [Cerrena zonata]|uniref:Major facilitator superfamily (MFS) profile domain-containing protein n=1 Tax=Cerrena zonata TaxID=2478898 RepID=A0AAW0GC99_9APHY